MNTTTEATPKDLKRLNEAVLIPGDIVLTTTTALISKTIRFATRSDISHAMVYVADRSVIDATSEGVHSRNTQRLFFEEECSVHVMRLRAGISDNELTAVLTYIRGHIGTEYSNKEVVRTVLGGAQDWTNKQFCSRLVAQAFSSIDILLVADPNFCSPADLKNSPLLASVPSPTVMVTAQEIAFWESREDVPQLMRDAINIVLCGAREKDPKIQTFDDLHSHLLSHPEHDDYFCRLLDSSGYLLIWKIELEKNPWQYDLNIMSVESARGSMADYCWTVLNNEYVGPNRYIANRGGYMVFSLQSGLKFFRIMLDLYERLATLHRLRVNVATRWLEANGGLERREPSHLIPHTPDWFEVLERWDPRQAMMTRQVIELAGKPDICSICGDDPATDYYLPEEHRSAGGVDTFRLCSDCVVIRREGGEPFIPL